MNSTCKQAALLKALRVCKKTTNKNFPALDCVLLDAYDGGLELRSTDLNTFTTIYVDGETSEGGRALLPINELLELVKNLPKGDVVIRKDADAFSATVNYIDVYGKDPDDFPDVPTMAAEQVVAVNRHKLQEAIEMTSFCASRDATRQQLQAIAIDSCGVFATDGKRLAEYHMPELATISALIPLSSATVMLAALKLLPKCVGRVELQIDKARLTALLATGQSYIQSKMIQGTLPDYKALIPTEFKTTVAVEADDLHQAVKVASATLDKENQVVTLQADGAFHVVSKMAKVPIPAATVEGDDNHAAFTVPFLLEPLKKCKKRTVKLGIDNSKDVATLTCDAWTYAFMPVQIK